MYSNISVTFLACSKPSLCCHDDVILLFIIVIATASSELEEFLDFIGERVRMKGFDGYRAQLDNKSE